MKRDWDTIRKILMDVEENGRAEYEAYPRDQEGNRLDEGELGEFLHTQMLEEAGFLKATFYSNASCTVWGLTWEGYDILDSIRNDSVWENVKAKLASNEIASVPLEIMKGLAVSYLKQNLGL